MASIEAKDESLDSHWAVAVIAPDERAELLAFAEQSARHLTAGRWPDQPIPDRLLPLASAYEFAAREWLDLDGIGNPSAAATPEQSVVRRARVELGASRAFLLSAPLPLDDTDQTGALYHTLLLAALAEIAGRQTEFRHWLRLHRAHVFPEEQPGERWDAVLLRRVVELWTEVLDGTGPSGLDHAMELVAGIREERVRREHDLLPALDESDRMRMRFYLFALFHLTEAATEVLLYRLHGQPEDARHRVFLNLSLGREATVGDARMHPPLEWLYEAASRVIAHRTPQLELLPEHNRPGQVH